MHVEDSYEGAVRRLERLQNAGFDLRPATVDDEPDFAARLRDLEELATLACDENERLERELAAARDQIGSLQRLLEEATDEPPARDVDAQRELSVAHAQIERLQRHVAMLVEAPAPIAPAKPRRPFLALLLGAAAGALVCAALMASPAEHARPNLPPPVAPVPPPVVAAPVAPPVVAAPVAPVVKPPIAPAVVAPPVVVPTVVVPRPRPKAPAKKRAEHHRHAERASRKVADKGAWTHTNDPLGGLNL